MYYLIFAYKGSSRDLKRIILAILKSGLANDIKKINYVHDYSLVDNKVEKEEEKLILIRVQNQDGLLKFLAEEFPQLEKIEIK